VTAAAAEASETAFAATETASERSANGDSSDATTETALASTKAATETSATEASADARTAETAANAGSAITAEAATIAAETTNAQTANVATSVALSRNDGDSSGDGSGNRVVVRNDQVRATRTVLATWAATESAWTAVTAMTTTAHGNWNSDSGNRLQTDAQELGTAITTETFFARLRHRAQN